MNFLGRMMQKISAFFYGRNGYDRLFRLCVWSAFALQIIALFFRGTAYTVISLLAYALLLYAVFRFMSRNVAKRREEDLKYTEFVSGIKSRFADVRNRSADRKVHVYRTCPGCGAKLRLPRKKGKHTVRCPKCGKNFDTKI